MSYRTVVLSSIQECFEDCFRGDYDSPQERAVQECERKDRLSRFPYAVMLKVSFAELDFANRWCWQQLGPSDGKCTQRYAEYRVCELTDPHSHVGTWMSYWFD